MTEQQKSKRDYTVMIVDDDRFLLDMYTLKFTESGFDVISSFGSGDALGKLREGLVPDIMLLDVVMPKMSGFELMQVINNEKLGGSAVKIVLSNLGQPADIEKGETLGASGYIVKASATPTEVVGKVREIFGAVKNN